MDDAAVDFAVAAWREDGLWQVVLLPPGTGETLEGLVDAEPILDGESLSPDLGADTTSPVAERMTGQRQDL